jgi:SAM-dependent methyltransferase
MNYRLAYSFGFHPWEDAATDAAFATKISDMFDREESGREPPFGRVLDIGTGSGIWGVELAKRGWQVTGIDIVDKALRRGRGRATEAGVEMGFVQGDVTALETAGVDSDFRLVLDTGTFHDFDEAQRKAMGRGVTAVTSADATVLLLVWPKRRRPLIRGASRDEVEQAFPDWEITHIEPSNFRLPKPMQLLLRPDEHWYRLRPQRHPALAGDTRRSQGADATS